MDNSILYYPTIEFQESDYQWLWTSALLWDKIYRIVPPEYELNEPSNIRTLCESGDIGIPLSPQMYAEKMSEEFSDFMDKNRDAAALSITDSDDYQQYMRIHKTKMDVKLKNKLLYDLRSTDSNDDWIYLNRETANFYMTFLANYMAKENTLSLYTGSRELWTASTYFLYDGRPQAYFLPGKEYIEPSAEAVVSVMIPDIYPQGILNVPPNEILRFREKRKDERTQFIEAIDNFRNKISSATAPEILKGIVDEEKKKMEAAITDYKKSMDILKIVRFGGILTTVLTLTADALGYLPFPQTVTPIIASSGLGVEVLTGLAEKRLNRQSSNPYTYLANISSSFGSYFAHCTDYQNMPQLSRYNYDLYRDFEEFIND